MYIYDVLKMCFVHIPKTGGTALKKHLRRQSGRRVGSKHGSFAALPSECENYFKFMVVRHPYERFASQARYRLQHSTRPVEWGSVSEMIRRDYLLSGHPRRPLLLQTSYLARRTDVTVYRFEKLQEAMRALSSRFGIPMLKPKSAEGLWFGNYNWRKWLDAEAIATINDLCDEDFHAFGYKKWTG